jgi:hypothetical protein
MKLEFFSESFNGKTDRGMDQILGKDKINEY